MLLANATALQTDQLRNLPQYCSQWDLYKKLCSAVAELQVREVSCKTIYVMCSITGKVSLDQTLLAVCDAQLSDVVMCVLPSSPLVYPPCDK